jgi:hypothetical protein
VTADPGRRKTTAQQLITPVSLPDRDHEAINMRRLADMEIGLHNNDIPPVRRKSRVSYVLLMYFPVNYKGYFIQEYIR